MAYFCLLSLTHAMPTRRWQQHPFSTVNSCFWNSRKLVKLKIAHSQWDSNPRRIDHTQSAISTELQECDTFQYMLDTGSGDIDILFVKIKKSIVNHARPTEFISNCKQFFMDHSKIAHPGWDSNPLTLDYMLSALPAELRESDTFQFLTWDTGSGDRAIFVYKG